MKFSKQRRDGERGDRVLKRIYVDSNVFVDVEIPEREHHQKSKEFMDKVLCLHDIRVCTSIYTSLEIASALRRQKGLRAIYHYLYDMHRKYKEGQVMWLSPMKKSVDFSHLVEKLIETSINHSTPSGDTIHVLTMLEHRTKILITWDKKDFENVRGRKEIFTPEEFLGTLETEKTEN